MVASGHAESVGHLAESLVESTDAVSLKPSTEERVWRLVHSSLTSSLTQIVGEWAVGHLVYRGDTQRLTQAVDLQIDQTDIEITRDFFRNPAGLPVVRKVQA